MYLFLRVVQKEGEESGFIQVAKQHSGTCGDLIGSLTFEDEGDRKYLIRLLTGGRATAPVEYSTEPFPMKCPVCGKEGSVRLE